MTVIQSIRDLYSNFRQFFKYCIVGVLGTFVDLGALYVLVEYFEMAVMPAVVLSFLLAVVNNYVLNKIWTFGSRSKNYRKQFIKFLIVSVVGLGLTVGFMYVFVEVFVIWYMIAKALTSLIVLVWNFLGNKYWTFKISPRLFHKLSEYKYDVSIIVPSYNEENRIKGTLLAIEDFIESSSLKIEVLVVDDGSSDKTCEVVEKEIKDVDYDLKLVRSGKNYGKGNAVRLGVEAAVGEYILFTDADNSTPIQELDKFWKFIEEGYDVIIGSRYLKNSDVKVRQSRLRILIGRAGNILIRLFLITGIKDTQCGFKLFTHKAAKDIFSRQKVRRFGFDMEALVVAKSLDYSIKEVPVSWFNSVESRVRPVRDSLRTLKDLAYIKLNSWSGRYGD
jgi:dolichyl-phosphate beta-glucosyltransferase